MKIVKPAPIPPRYHLTCRHCQAVVESLASEMIFEADQRDGNARVLECPGCGGKTWFAVETLPRYLAKES